ncbi:cilium assembly protein DZIP1 isoform X2 [Denticeps clupeoides]|uniref:cilium assembly protein DZIP1 isoform X2 n=1 Tax=Denticeps clupeoides TaxID=299321 RepID=UPI0010A457E9|nr:zinc finger protein Dzip1-like isoform X2 [Denticeps clupeoides]
MRPVWNVRLPTSPASASNNFCRREQRFFKISFPTKLRKKARICRNSADLATRGTRELGDVLVCFHGDGKDALFRCRRARLNGRKEEEEESVQNPPPKMPFYNNVYYPYQSDVQGAPSSAGIPSLLNSPQSHHSSGSQGAPAGAAMSAAPASGITLPPSIFRPRRESIDWRRINAVDVDRVAAELDIAALLEHVNGVTFCNLEVEKCQRCQSPVDPALLKLFRLAQFTVEYLLHTQDHQSHSLRVVKDKVEAVEREREQLRSDLQSKMQKQTESLKTLKDELKQRKKIIASQQAMITAGMASYHKCQHCDKAFLNASYLQSHMQRRHPEEYDFNLMSENQRKLQSVRFQEEITKLKEQLEAQQQTYITKSSQEQMMKEHMMKELEKWKEEERKNMNRQMDEIRERNNRDMDSLYKRNATLEKQLTKVLETNSLLMTKIDSRQSSSSTTHGQEERYQLEVLSLQQQLQRQEEKWTSKLDKVKTKYETETNKLSEDLQSMQMSLSDQKERSRRRAEKMDHRLQEQQQLLASQAQQINSQMRPITSSPVSIVMECPAEASIPDKKSIPVTYEPSPSLHKLDPIEEQSEEDKDSSISESRSALVIQQAKSFMKNPGARQDMRHIVEQAFVQRLEGNRVKRGARSISKEEYSRIMSTVLSKRRETVRVDPKYKFVEEEIRRTLDQRLRTRLEGGDLVPDQNSQTMQSAQARPRSSSLPSRVTRVVSGPVAKLLLTPQPAPRSRTNTLPKTSTPKSVYSSRTSPFSTDEESDEETPPQKPKTLQAKAQLSTAPQAAKVTQAKSLKLSALPAKEPQVKSSAALVTKTTVTAVESESEWTEGSEMEEIDPKQLQRAHNHGQNGNMNHNNVHGYLVKDLTRSLEKQLAERGPKKPAGGVNTVQDKNDTVRELKFNKDNKSDDDDDDDDDEDDWDISSLEDAPLAPPTTKQSPLLVKRSVESTSTSIWGTSSSKGPKPGLTEAGTGSTLKSSLVTVSDWSDSDGI